MTTNIAAKTVLADSYLTLHYSVALEDGTIVMGTFGDKPATLMLGQGQFSPHLEQAMLGMAEGERRTFTLPAEQGFGARNPELVQRIAMKALRDNGVLPADYAAGDMIEFYAPDGTKYAGVLKEVGETACLFDFNHPLAGQTIVFEAQIIAVL